MRHITQQITEIRNQIDAAESARDQTQIGHILIALAQLVDVVETLADRARYDDIQRENAG